MDLSDDYKETETSNQNQRRINIPVISNILINCLVIVMKNHFRNELTIYLN